MRRFIWISGSSHWCNLNTSALIQCLPKDVQQIIYCGSEPQTLTKQQVNIESTSKRGIIEHYLGTQCTALIVNCFNGFNPELFCALCGTVQSPGIILLTTPPSIDWPSHPDPDSLKLCSFPFSEKDIKGRFIHYFIHKLKQVDQSESIIFMSENDSSNEFIDRIQTQVRQLFSQADTKKTRQLILNEQQKRVVRVVDSLLNSNSSAVLILSGKRGRGKSSILGIALNAYAANSSQPITVCVVSQTRSNIQPLITQLCHKHTDLGVNKLTYRSLSLLFRPPDELLKQELEIDLLIIDEAAAIPLPQLYRIIGSYRKIILSTTTDGYEGTGMGFSFKLKKRLEKYKKPVYQLQLTQALRWPENDPVEDFLNNSLLLRNSDTPTATDDYEKITVDDLIFEKLDRDELISRSGFVEQIFSLLSLAHYRTTPDDLRYLLDAPEIEIWIAHRYNLVYAAMMVNREGGLPDELQDDIWLGKRRLRGHLSPQCISAQCGFNSASAFHFKRIVRIAVNIPNQNIGIGKKLVNMAIESESAKFLPDYYSVSFGFEDQLLEFWRALGFSAIKLGFRRNARSGEKSIMMLRPVSERSFKLTTSLYQRFRNDLEFQSRYASNYSDHLSNSWGHHLREPGHNRRIEVKAAVNDFQDKQDIFSFAFGHRQIAHCHWVLSKYANLILNTQTRNLFTADQVKLLTFRILQNKGWSACSNLLGYTGKKEALADLRRVFAIIYCATWGNKS